MRRSARAAGWCESCQKLLYASRKVARKVSKEHREDHKSEYPCPTNRTMFHVGGLPDEVITGQMTRTEYFGSVS